MLNTLTQKYQAQKATNSDELNLRLHRALSWLKHADNSDDLDMKFISLWIGFNVVYAKEFVGLNSPDRQRFVAFLNDICQLDKDKRIYELIWQKFPPKHSGHA